MSNVNLNASTVIYLLLAYIFPQ